MRVTGGTLGGRRLAAPPRGVRPTADRVREALFARMAALEDALVLDLYAGTGALGIEALSRGAREVVFVERSERSAAVLRRNLAALGLEPRARLLRSDVRSALRRLARERRRFDLILADPPYDDAEAAEVLASLGRAGILVPTGTLVVERSRRHPLPPVAGFVAGESRRYGDTVMTWFAPATREADAGAPGSADEVGRAEREPGTEPGTGRGDREA